MSNNIPSGKPVFGKTWIISPHASEDNPYRRGMFVETIVISRGKMNAGNHYRATDGNGNFWMVPVASALTEEDEAHECMQSQAREIERLKGARDCAEYILDNGTRFVWSESNVQYEEVPQDGESFTLLRHRLKEQEATVERLRGALTGLKATVDEWLEKTPSEVNGVEDEQDSKLANALDTAGAALARKDSTNE